MTPVDGLSVAHFSLADGGGGAAGAVRRLHRELARQGVRSTLHVANRHTSDADTIDVSAGKLLGRHALSIARKIDLLPVRVLHPSSNAFWSPGWHSLRDLTRRSSVRDADVLALYWLPRGFLGIRQVGRLLALAKPVVWRLSDMWPFTGGCHYSGDCSRYELGCGACPQLRSTNPRDLSARLSASKRAHWRGADLTVISPSAWMAQAASRSTILHGRDIRVIATGVDTDVFQPADAAQARRELGLPLDRPLVLFGADAALRDERKGSGVALAVMRQLASNAKQRAAPALVLFGTSARPEGLPDSVPVHALGVIADDARLAKIYAACDVFLAPSAQENLANTVLEAMACGTPVVAFAIGGMNEAIEHGSDGMLVPAGDVAALGEATAALLADATRRRELSGQARTRALANFDLRTQAARWVALYREKLDSARGAQP